MLQSLADDENDKKVSLDHIYSLLVSVFVAKTRGSY